MFLIFHMGKQSDTHANSVAERESLSEMFSSITSILNDELDPILELPVPS